MNYQKRTQKEDQAVLEAPESSKQKIFDGVCMTMAQAVAQLSHCKRSQVGAVIESRGNIVSFGYNGTPTGMDNCCEDSSGNTKPSVLHAEMNAVIKAAKTGNSVEGSTLYVTLSPCVDCAKYLLQSGIQRVVYLEEYRDKSGIELLKQFIKVEKHENINQ
jgi:dCMP deaminase